METYSLVDKTRMVSLVAAEDLYWDPASQQVGRQHDGRHGTILMQIATSPQFLRHCQQVRADLERHFARNPGQPCTVIFRCKRGRHRSVALAYLFSVALSWYRQAEVVMQTPALDMDRGGCGCPAQCKHMHRAEAHRHWGAVQEASRLARDRYWNCWG